ncbi:helicase-related protein [Paenibacillus sp. LHD-117]|uniref:DEAD/DEAH box helicase n=1 Tax=Paenibacillus sp. LHD-117 TaxID=3071412 RepID=UPI0027E1DC95|nr:helicase-related protein [Paenibacillus sp. LHD-117]MDQ6422511.1 helicase-related protein [Paenibacillus sp. LHD-117]
MKARVYVLRKKEEWSAWLTLAPEVDYAYWFGKLSAWEEAECAWFWQDELPLGQAVQAVSLWKERAARPKGIRIAGLSALWDRGGSGGHPSNRRGAEFAPGRWLGEADAVGIMSEVIDEVKAADDGIGRKRLMRWAWIKEALGEQEQRGKGSLLAESREAYRLEGTQTIQHDERGNEPLTNRYAKTTISQTGEVARSATNRERGGACRSLQANKEAERRTKEANRSVVRWSAGDGRRVMDAARWSHVAAIAKLAAGLLQGRALLSVEARALLAGAAVPGAEADWSEAIQLAALLGQVRLSGAVAAPAGKRADARRRLRCLRCGSGEAHLRRTACLSCGRDCAYCEACILMGRSRECELLIQGMYDSPIWKEQSIGRWKAMRQQPMQDRLAKWNLSPAQQEAAGKALRFIEERPWAGAGRGESANSANRDFLIWAVTGAGKTEMVFPLVESVMNRGGRTLIASPRRDVVLELDPRIRRAFPNSRVVTLYGGSEQRWEKGDITLSTTHQLLRYHEAFDLVIVDEIDAFPYHGDPMLHYAADKSRLSASPKILLSATPPRAMQSEARRGKLAHARVPVRYHLHPLPVPRQLHAPSVRQLLANGRFPSSLLRALRQSLKRGAQIFFFVQRISESEPMAALLRNKLLAVPIEATSSQDPERAEKVARFRSAITRLLVTTTILERGVTIPKSDVFIMDADGKLFDEASLVQMAGRAGRSADDPAGKVYFFGIARTLSQLRAVRHIRSMNRTAAKQGFLLPSLARNNKREER